jgi:hypothetical protein
MSEGVAQRGAFGGVSRYFERAGAGRHQLSVTIPPQALGDTAASWAGKLAQALNDERIVRLGVPQLNDSFTSITGALINGSSQLGKTLVIDTASPSTATVKAGRYFSIIVSSVSYLFQNVADVTLSGGAGTLSLDGLLNRCSPADNTAIEFNAPIIEGYLGGNAESWTRELIVAQGLSFTIEEQS